MGKSVESTVVTQYSREHMGPGAEMFGNMTVPVFVVDSQNISLELPDPPSHLTKESERVFLSEQRIINEILVKLAYEIKQRTPEITDTDLAIRTVDIFVRYLDIMGWTSLSRIIAVAYGVVREENAVRCVSDPQLLKNAWIQEATSLSSKGAISKERITGIRLLIELFEIPIPEDLSSRYFATQEESEGKSRDPRLAFKTVHQCVRFFENAKLVQSNQEKIIAELQLFDDQSGTTYTDIFCQLYRIGVYASPYAGVSTKLSGYLDKEKYDPGMVYKALDRGRSIAERIALGTFGEYEWVQQKGKLKKGYSSLSSSSTTRRKSPAKQPTKLARERIPKKTPVDEKIEQRLRDQRNKESLENKRLGYNRVLKQKRDSLLTLLLEYQQTDTLCRQLSETTARFLLKLNAQEGSFKSLGISISTTEALTVADIEYQLPEVPAEEDIIFTPFDASTLAMIGYQDALEQQEQLYDSIAAQLDTLNQRLGAIVQRRKDDHLTIANASKYYGERSRFLLLLHGRRETHINMIAEANNSIAALRLDAVQLEPTIGDNFQKYRSVVVQYQTIFAAIATKEGLAQAAGLRVNITSEVSFNIQGPLHIDIPELINVNVAPLSVEDMDEQEMTDAINAQQERESTQANEQIELFENLINEVARYLEMLSQESNRAQQLIEELKQRDTDLDELIEANVNEEEVVDDTHDEPMPVVEERKTRTVSKERFQRLLEEGEYLVLLKHDGKKSKIKLTPEQRKTLVESWPKDGADMGEGRGRMMVTSIGMFFERR